MTEAAERLFRYVGDTWGLAGFLLLALIVVGALVIVAVVFLVLKLLVVPALSSVGPMFKAVIQLPDLMAEYTEVLRGLRDDERREAETVRDLGEAQRREGESTRQVLQLHHDRVMSALRERDRS